MKDVVYLVRERLFTLIQLHLDGRVRRLLKLQPVIEHDHVVLVVRVKVSPRLLEYIYLILAQHPRRFKKALLIAAGLHQPELIHHRPVRRLQRLADLCGQTDAAGSVVCVAEQLQELVRLVLLIPYPEAIIFINRVVVTHYRDVNIRDVVQPGHGISVTLNVGVAALSEQIILDHRTLELERVQRVPGVAVQQLRPAVVLDQLDFAVFVLVKLNRHTRDRAGDEIDRARYCRDRHRVLPRDRFA